MNTWSVACPAEHAGPAVGLAAKESVSVSPELAPVSPDPRLRDLLQIVPPLTVIGSATPSVPELSITPSWMKPALWPDGLEISSASPDSTVIVPAPAFCQDQPFCSELVSVEPSMLSA